MKGREETPSKTSRRKFMQYTGAMIGGMALPITPLQSVFAGNNNTLKIGLIGCGGRGAGAASQALAADPNSVLTAMGDVFSDRLDESLVALQELYPNRVKVNKGDRYIGFDAYQKVINSGVDIVLLATPPAFRPDHMAAAVEAGKHTFCEKPVAIDAPGVRKVLAAAKRAKEKNLSVVSGLCFRYDNPKRELFSKVLGGEIGEIKTISTIRNGGPLWSKPMQPGWTDMEYRLRNWLYYTWLSGDFITEMMVHSLDMMAWAMGDKPPLKATGTGGRQVRVEEIYGNAYDHFAIEYEYEHGVRGYHFSRQQDGCSNVNKVEIAGTLGNALIGGASGHEITGKSKWAFEGKRNDMYQTEHDELFASIRNNKPINNGEWMATSTMLAILGRMAAYTGQTITWDEAINSNQVLGPTADQYSWDLKWPGKEVARPGITRLF
ncbi:MAG: Gfo/Idh/MocA family oxidoreductase [Cyclobacteriaceae bacterium]|nr:Gfo/Idh/MocA family oxidoreductase [Cyclobacteriaceae bacterium]